MKGLLLKDLYTMVKNLRLFLILILLSPGFVFLGTDSSFFIIYGMVMISAICVSLISYDERYHWDTYADAMPLSRALAVTEKYLLNLILVLLMLLIVLLANCFQAEPLFRSTAGLICFMLSIGLLMPGFLLPIIFAVGSEKGRIAYYIFIFASMALAAGLSSVASELPDLPTISISIWLCLLPPAVYALSWRIAVALYNKRVL